jgi:anti-sigma factor RsiW
MTCAELLQAIDPYLDDELSVLEVLRVQAHTLRCDRCRAAMASEVRLHALLEADSLQDEPPPSLRERILQGLAAPAGTAARHRRPRWLAGPYVLAAVLLVAVLLAAAGVVRLPTASSVPPYLEEVAAKHRLYTDAGGPPLELATTGVGRLTGPLAGRVGFPLKAPARLRPGERLVGGRVSSLADAPAAYLLYERNDRPLSLFISRRPTPAPAEGTRWMVEGAELYTSRVHDLTLVWWDDGDRLYTAASSGDPWDLAEFALLCIRSGSPPT